MHAQHCTLFSVCNCAPVRSVRICSVSDALRSPPAPCTAPIYPARPVWYRVQTGAACTASGRACRCVACCGQSALYLTRLALLFVLCSPSGCAGGWGLHSRGIQEAPGVGQVMPAHSEANKKGIPLANTHPTFTNPNPSDCASLQKFQKIQKDPFRSLDCVIIS